MFWISPRKVLSLQGLEKDRVSIARTILHDPPVLFFDEPTAGLDPIVCGVIDKLILDLSRKLSITSVVVTHDMNSVFRIADRIIMLYEGHVIADGTADEIRNSSDARIQQFIKGEADGPISFVQSKDDYLDQLIQ